MSKQMSNPPLYYVLGQVQFNPITAVGRYIPDIQDALRKKGYPLFSQQIHMQLQFTNVAGAAGEPSVNQITHFLFTRSDKSFGFVLGPEFLTLHTTNYSNREDFIEELLEGLNAVHEVLQLDHVSRIGLRYIDAVVPRHGEELEDYLSESLHGISVGSAKPIQSTYEMVCQTECGPVISEGTLVSRYFKLNGALGLPPDLNLGELQPKEKFVGVGDVRHGIIDVDHYVQGMIPVELHSIKKQMVNINDAVRVVFDAMTSDHAREVWR